MDKHLAHILVVDDDDRIRELVKQYLIENKYLVTTAKDAFDAKNKIEIIKFDLAVLDIMMPKKSGLELTSEVKKEIDLPIILLTAKGETSERVMGLEFGADDYLSKPFEPKELLLRIKNILNKTLQKNNINKISIGSSNLDLNKLTINKNGKKYKINNTEKLILEKMIRSSGKVFSREEMGKLININKERSVDVIITRLRQKIETDSKNPQYLQTIRGSGYVLWIE
ncbi:MAG: response regulator transcription factor [Pelagibacteraceae bacterium]|jgi:two-component system phosphate regulon response regulator OmpR|nr:response regulator transcription factor [Pelagibacteraceae bacterium]MBO6493140.1 response regulator transcription factor [Pelagibacteraceae bacterium]